MLDGGWNTVHVRVVSWLLFWAMSMVIAVCVAFANYADLSTMLSTSAASVSLLMVSYHAFRLRALYEFDEQSRVSLKSDIHHLRRVRSHDCIS